jgi:hypothetical protein
MATTRKIKKVLTKNSEEKEWLNTKNIKIIELSLEDIKRGRVRSTKEVKRKLGIKI